MTRSFPHYSQIDSMYCGATCLRMVAKYYGKSYSNQYLREKSFITREGVSMLGIADAAESIDFRTVGARVSMAHQQTPVFYNKKTITFVRQKRAPCYKN